MGTQNPGQERSPLAMFSIARSLVQIFSFLTALFFFYIEFALVPKFQTGITLTENLAVKQNFYRSDPRGAFGAWSRRTLRAFLYYVRRGRYRVQQISSLAFGGRCVGLIHNANLTVAHVDFDSTKGYPGEG